MAKKDLNWNKILTYGGYYTLALGAWAIIHPYVFSEVFADSEPNNMNYAIVFFVLGLTAICKRYFKLFLVMFAASGLMRSWRILQMREYLEKAYLPTIQDYFIIAAYVAVTIIFVGYFYYSQDVRKEFKVLEPYPQKPSWYPLASKVLWTFALGFALVALYFSLSPFLQ